MTDRPERACQVSDDNLTAEARIEEMEKWIQLLGEMIRFCDEQNQDATSRMSEETELQQVVQQFERIRDYFYVNIDTAAEPQDDIDGMMELQEDPQVEQQETVFEIVLDAEGGYYDEEGYYYDKDGQCFAPPEVPAVPEGHVLCYAPEVMKKLTQSEKEQVRREHAAELQLLGPSTLRIKEEKLGLKKLRKPTVMHLNGFTTIATSDGIYMQPYFFRDRYPGYVRDIEEVEGSFDPALQATNPPRSVKERDGKTAPKPYKGEQPKEKKQRTE